MPVREVNEYATSHRPRTSSARAVRSRGDSQQSRAPPAGLQQDNTDEALAQRADTDTPGARLSGVLLRLTRTQKQVCGTTSIAPSLTWLECSYIALKI